MTAVLDLKKDLDSEMKLGTKMVVNWDMYLEREKVQITKAFQYGVSEGVLTDINYLNCDSEAEHYYNETYCDPQNSQEYKTGKLIFVSSPYTNPDEEVRQRNYQQVSEFASDLIEKGHVVFSPILYGHTVSNIRKGMPTDWDFWKKFCLTFLIKCDELIVYQMEGWDASKGVREEIEFAKKNGIKVTYCTFSE